MELPDAGPCQPEASRRLEALPKSARDIAWKGQLRMCQRYGHLFAAGKAKAVVITAIAREMAGFLWALAKARAVPLGNTEVREGQETERTCIGLMCMVGGGTRSGTFVGCHGRATPMPDP